MKNLKPLASPEPASRLTSRGLGVAAGKVRKGKGDKMQIMDLVMWDEKRRFRGEMTPLVSGESREANLHDIFPTKLGSFRASGVNWCYFHASFYVNCFGICVSQSPNESFTFSTCCYHLFNSSASNMPISLPLLILY